MGPPVAPSAFEIGETVKVARYGEGVVACVKGEEVTVKFPDKSTRSFLSSFIRKPKARGWHRGQALSRIANDIDVCG